MDEKNICCIMCKHNVGNQCTKNSGKCLNDKRTYGQRKRGKYGFYYNDFEPIAPEYTSGEQDTYTLSEESIMIYAIAVYKLTKTEEE